MQRTVIKACIDQWVKLGNVTKIGTAVDLLENNSISSLSVPNYLWMGKTLVKCLGGEFTTQTLPGYADYIGNVSYYILDRDTVAETINRDFNPYETLIDPSQLDIAG